MKACSSCDKRSCPPRYLVATLAILSLTPITARATTAEDFQVWSSLQASGSISGNVVGGLEFAGRFVDDFSRLGVGIVRPTIGYKVSDAVTVHLGYAYQTTLIPDRRDLQENRIFQQINWTMGKAGSGTFSSRTRLEERSLNTGDDTGLRFRFQLKYTVPLKAKRTNLVIASEPFIALNSTDWGQRAGIDQWRNFVGVNFPVATNITLETGFQHRYQKFVDRPDRSDFIVPLTLAYKF